MILIDSALEKRQSEGNPIRVGVVGAGFMARGIALQIMQSVPGMELVAISNRTIDAARRAFSEAEAKNIIEVNSTKALEIAIQKGYPAITEDAELLCKVDLIDVIVEVTGSVEFGARIVSAAIDHGKHVVLMNAELDGTIGPILHQKAKKAGVVFTNADGDQPGVIMNLYRFVKSIGVKPVLCGNIKGLHDPYRNPTTQEAFAKQWKQKPHMVTSFADGTKISFEQGIVANATGMRVAKRGMHGPTVDPGTPIQKAITEFSVEELMASETGIVDYVVSAEPGPGVFVLGTHDNPLQQHYLNLYKLGPGPLYCFHTPYHLCHFEVPMTIARAALFNDATIAPTHGLMIDVVATAKINLQSGQTLDGMGYYMTYGLAENADIAYAQNLLPIGLAEGCRLKRDIPKDQVLTYADVEVPPGRYCDSLREEQTRLFFPP